MGDLLGSAGELSRFLGEVMSDFANAVNNVVNCPWMTYANQELDAGVREDTRRGRSNPRVTEYLRTVGFSDDSVAWCSAFVNWCMIQGGKTGTNRANARSWRNWGDPIADPRYGAVTVFTRPPNPAHGHVAFYVGIEGSNILVLGGNQDNRVKIKGYPAARLLGYRWPSS